MDHEQRSKLDSNGADEDSQRDSSFADSTLDAVANDDQLSRELLVAYLDGELTPAESERIEQRLTRDPKFHAELIKLQRTWDLLDHLPRGEVSESFTQSTVELVTQSLETEIAAKNQQRRRIQWLATLAFVAVVCVAIIGGFAYGQWLQNSPARRLVRDLPLIENADSYRNAESIEFLERLKSEGLFEPDPETDAEAESAGN